MSHILKHASATALCVLSFQLTAQVGLWEATKVTVGDQLMTPVAKWFDIRENGEVISGNGGLINIQGTFTYDPETSQALFTDENSIPDEYGAFTIEFDDKQMTWRRIEDGQEVTVHLKRIYKLPKAPWDKIVGLWSDESDTGDQLFMGWDRSYRLDSESSPHRGTWQIPAHQSQLMLYRQDGQTNQWALDFPTDSTMVWTSEFGEEKVFVRE
jgi:hypothetical protein